MIHNARTSINTVAKESAPLSNAQIVKLILIAEILSQIIRPNVVKENVRQAVLTRNLAKGERGNLKCSSKEH